MCPLSCCNWTRMVILFLMLFVVTDRIGNINASSLFQGKNNCTFQNKWLYTFKILNSQQHLFLVIPSSQHFRRGWFFSFFLSFSFFFRKVNIFSPLYLQNTLKTQRISGSPFAIGWKIQKKSVPFHLSVSCHPFPSLPGSLTLLLPSLCELAFFLCCSNGNRWLFFSRGWP